MADGSFPTLVSKDRDSNATGNPIYVQLSDGTDLALIDGAGNLNVKCAANSGVDIGDVDVLSVIPGTGATNLGKAVDSAGGATDTGVASLAIRDDALTTLTPADGDYVRLRTDSTGALWVNSTSASSAPSKVDDSAFAIASDNVSPSGYLADETAPDSVDEGDVGLARMTLDRKQLMVITDATNDARRLVIDANGYITSNINGTITVDANGSDVTVDNGAGGAAVNIQDGGNSITVDNAALSVVGGGAEATALRVTIANDSTGLLSVDDNGGSLTVDSLAEKVDDAAFAVGTDSVVAIGAMADETAPDSVDEGDIGIPRMTLDRKMLTRIVGASDANRLDIDASGHAQVDLAAVSVTAVPVSADSSANSETNPIYVQVVSGIVSGVEQHDYDTAAAVASDATDNHDVTVTGGKTFMLKSVILSGSGNIKGELQFGPLAGLATVAVIFLTGRNGDTQQLFFDPPIEVPDTGTGTIRLIRTNRQGAATDLYSTIIGVEV